MRLNCVPVKLAQDIYYLLIEGNSKAKLYQLEDIYSSAENKSHTLYIKISMQLLSELIGIGDYRYLSLVVGLRMQRV